MLSLLKIPKKLGLGRDNLNIIKSHMWKTCSKHHTQCEKKKMKAFPLTSGPRQRCPLRIAEEAKKHRETKF